MLLKIRFKYEKNSLFMKRSIHKYYLFILCIYCVYLCMKKNTLI